MPKNKRKKVMTVDIQDMGGILLKISCLIKSFGKLG